MLKADTRGLLHSPMWSGKKATPFANFLKGGLKIAPSLMIEFFPIFSVARSPRRMHPSIMMVFPLRMIF